MARATCVSFGGRASTRSLSQGTFSKGTHRYVSTIRHPHHCIHVAASTNGLELLVEQFQESSQQSAKSFHMNPVSKTASMALNKGDTIISVPDSLWLTKSAVMSESSLGERLKELDGWVALALFLIYESGRKETKWAKFVESLLNGNVYSPPILWRQEELAMLDGTQIADSVMSYKAFFLQTFEGLQSMEDSVISFIEKETGDIVTEDMFVRAACIVRASSQAPLTGEQLAIVPGVDALSHARASSTLGANCELEVQSGVALGNLFGGGQKALVVKATKSIAEGDPVCFDIAPGCTEGHVLLNHGTVDINAPGTFAITLVLPEEDRFFDDKIDILEMNGLQASTEFILQTGAPPPETMLAMLRLINLDNADAFLLESIFRNEVWGHVNLPVSEENESAVYESMMSGCAAVLQSYPTKIDDDIARLKVMKSIDKDALSIEDRNAMMAIALRLGEKEVLEATLRFFEGRMDILKDLEYYGERRLKRLGLLDKEGKPTDWDSFFDDGIA
jgi:[ribulose-bisphosphate carboxylase]-lysine N-methyltransferase